MNLSNPLSIDLFPPKSDARVAHERDLSCEEGGEMSQGACAWRGLAAMLAGDQAADGIVRRWIEAGTGSVPAVIVPAEQAGPHYRRSSSRRAYEEFLKRSQLTAKAAGWDALADCSLACPRDMDCGIEHSEGTALHFESEI